MSSYPIPPSFQPNHGTTPGSSSAVPNFPYQQPVPAQRFQHGFPSAEQYGAITGTDASQNIHVNSSFHNDRVAANSLSQPPSSFPDPSSHIAPRSHWDQESYNVSKGPSVGEQNSPAATSNDHSRWCFECKNPKAIKTRDGFKRHMRERHAKRFYCMPLGPVVRTENGPKCAFCDVLDPDPRHLSTHNVEPCASAARSFSRESLLINHLKGHNIADGSMLAKRWQHTVVDKNYFACGFCVCWFGSLNEQLNHIDAHYRLSAQIRDWDSAKVIRGLLSQPPLNDHWRRAQAANPHLQESLLRWSPAVVKQLQHRLETSQEPPDVLCKVVIDESNYGRKDHGHVESLPFTGITGLEMGTSQSIQTFQNQNDLSLLPSTSEQSSTHAPRITAPTHQLHHLPQDLDRVNNLDRDTTYEGRPSPQIASQTYESPASAIDYHADHRAQPHSLPNGGESFTQPQYPVYVPLMASASGPSQASEGQARNSHTSRLGGHPQGVSSHVAINPRPRPMTDVQGYPAHPHTGWINPTLATQSAPSPLSRNRPTAPLDQVTSADSHSHRPTLSRQETTDWNGISMDADSDNMHPFMQGQHHTQDQRRFH